MIVFDLQCFLVNVKPAFDPLMLGSQAVGPPKERKTEVGEHPFIRDFGDFPEALRCARDEAAKWDFFRSDTFEDQSPRFEIDLFHVDPFDLLVGRCVEHRREKLFPCGNYTTLCA